MLLVESASTGETIGGLPTKLTVLALLSIPRMLNFAQ
jgi:hypothetical protein